MSGKDRRIENRKKLQSLLRELFQFDSADLDFGIYRIMNQKRDDIERFIERDLLDVVEQGLAHFQAAERESLQQAVEEKRQAAISALGQDVIDASGKVTKYHDAPAVQRYLDAVAALEQADVAEETEARVFNDLYTFFSRYYDNGDFLNERRYSSREHKFHVPYNGEEVLLHWANRDQYYVKTSERFTDYRFTVGDYTVWFRLGQADVPQDNVKGDKRYFVLRGDEPLAYDPETRTLTVRFEYRPLAEEEEAHLLGLYNAQLPKSSRRKTLDRSVLCMALEAEILDGLDDPGLKGRLAVVPEGKETSLLGQHLNRYTARNTMDYFVHKDLGGFLRRELDFFLKNEILRVDDFIADPSGEDFGHALTRARVVREIAEKIIAFLAQIEDFQKRLFEKKKFVVQTDYCLTLDRVPEAFYPEILADAAQLEEWRRLYRMDAWENDLFWRGEFDDAFLRHHPYLMLDTAFFDDDFKARLLAIFGEPSTGSGQGLDGATDGLLIQGENFQALNLLMEKHRGQVKCIYIDPPYNTGNDEFIYKDNYRHSSWLTMICDRLLLGSDLLSDGGAFFSSIDEREQHRLTLMIESICDSIESVGHVVWRKKKSFGRGHKFIIPQTEFVLAFVRNPASSEGFGLPYSESKEDRFTREDEQGRYRLLRLWHTAPSGAYERRTLQYSVYTPDGRLADSVTGQWLWSQERLQREIEKNNVEFVEQEDGSIRLYKKDYLEEGRLEKPTSYFDVVTTDNSARELNALFPNIEETFFAKPVGLIRHLISMGRANNHYVLDFFAGSGTTAHAVMNLNREDDGRRKYILVEIGDYFDTVLKPRIQKVAFSANWKDGVPQDRDGMSHMFKYQRLESYEDALNNLRVRPPEGAQLSLLEQFDDYMLHYMLDFETRDSPTLLKPEAFEKPFGYTLKIRRGHASPQDTVVDLVETFHYLIGLHVRRLERHPHQGRHYVVSWGEVRTERGIEKVVTIWRDTEGLDLEQEADWADEALLTEPVDRVYVNDPSFIEKAEPLEIAFRERMEGGHGGI